MPKQDQRKLAIGIATLGLIALLLWLALGGVVWSRNRLPSIGLPPQETMPAGNVYEKYLESIRNIRDKDALGGLDAGPLDAATRTRVLAKNRELLKNLHALVGQPSMVTHLEPRPGFVAALEYPSLGRLLSVEAQAQPPGAALQTLVDSLFICEDVMRGGATLHLTASYLTLITLIDAFPAAIAAAAAADCDRAARRLRTLIEGQYPASKVLRNERRVRMDQILRSLRPLAYRTFQLKMPASDEEWKYLLKEKTASVAALNAYLTRWEEVADQPAAAIEPPAMPAEINAINADETLQPENLLREVFRSRFKDTQFRLIYGALRLERHRKSRGRFPAALAELGADPLLTDPFTGKGLLYKPRGAGFALYSVGPNGKDEGGDPGRAISLRPGSSGDYAITRR